MGLDTSRVLRIGVVWRGQVLAERVLDRRVDVTVGSRPDATVSISPKDYPNFPAVIPLAIVHQGAYFVVLPADPAHTVSLRGGPPGSQGVDKNSVVTVKGQKALPVEAYTGGSVTLGDVIVMFQFVRGDSVPTQTREETVLRIGLVHEDRLLSDQLFHAGDPITIGVSAKSTIALPDIEYKGGDAVFKAAKGATSFAVHLPKGADLRLALDGQPPVNLQEALQKKLATQASDGGTEFLLPIKSRGRATLGPYTLLFQVVKQSITVPALPRKSVLVQLAGPLLADSTWTVSFLVAVLLIGSIVGQAILFHNTTGRFLDKQQGEEELVHTTFDVEIQEKEEPKPEEDKKEEIDVRSDSAKKAAEEKEKPVDKPAKKEKPESVGKPVDPEDAKRNARAAVQKNTLAGAFGQGASTKMFAADDGTGGDVVAKTFGGSGGDTGEGEGGPGKGLQLASTGGGGGTVEKVAGGKKGFGDRTDDATKAVVKKEENVVKVKLSAGGVEGGDGEAKGEVSKVISRKNSAVQQCYERALRDNPEEGGKVKVSFTVGTAGTVTDVTVSGASGGFADCIKNKFSAIRGLPLLPSPQSFNQSYVFSKS
jgi:outer membrane biosynthesis protein TonB